MGSDVEDQYIPPTANAAAEAVPLEEAAEAQNQANLVASANATDDPDVGELGGVPVMDGDVPPGEIDPSAAVQEPYGATLLRQAHSDGQALMMDYHEAMQVLDNPKVRAHMERILAGLEMNLQKAEAIFAEQYAQCDPLDPGSCGDGKDMSSMASESVPADSSPMVRPTSAEAAAGAARKSMGKKGKKSLGDQSTEDKDCHTLEDYEVKSCACSNCGHEVMLQVPQNDVAHEMFEPDPIAGRLYQEALGFLEEISEEGSDVQGADWGGKSWGEWERHKSYAYHKVMDDAADEAKKSLLKAMGVPPASMTTGALAASSTETANRRKRTSGESGYKSQGDSAMPEKYDPLDASLKLLGVKASYSPLAGGQVQGGDTEDYGSDVMVLDDGPEDYGSDVMVLDDDTSMEKAMSWLDSDRGGALVAPPARAIKKALLMTACRAASKFLHDAAGRKDFGMRDREAAKSLLSSIRKALAVEDALTPEQIAELTPVYEPGGCGSKADKPSWLGRLRNLFAATGESQGRPGQLAGEMVRDVGRAIKPQMPSASAGKPLHEYQRNPVSKPQPVGAREVHYSQVQQPATPKPAEDPAAGIRSRFHQSRAANSPSTGAGTESASNRQSMPVRAVPVSQSDGRGTVGTVRPVRPEGGTETTARTIDASNRTQSPGPGVGRSYTVRGDATQVAGARTRSDVSPEHASRSTTTADSDSASTQQMADYFKSAKSLTASNELLDRALNLLAAE